MKFCKKKTNVVSNQTVKTITVLIEIIQNENSLSYPEIDKTRLNSLFFLCIKRLQIQSIS